jgi:hypothetical protein
MECNPSTSPLEQLLFLSTFSVLGQLVYQSEPTELATRPRVVSRWQPVWGIKATSRDVDFVQEVFVLEGQLRAALRTETPRAFRSRTKPRGLTAHEPELRPRYAEPRDERSAGGSTTDRTMAICLMEGSTRCLITDPSAKASALEHSITCRFVFLHQLPAFSDRRHFDFPKSISLWLDQPIGSTDDEDAIFAGAAALGARPVKDDGITFFPRTSPARVSAFPPARRLPYAWPPTRDDRKGPRAGPSGRRKTDPSRACALWRRRPALS